MKRIYKIITDVVVVVVTLRLEAMKVGLVLYETFHWYKFI